MRLRLGPRPERRAIDLRLAAAAGLLILFGLARFFPFHRNPYICTFKQITGYPCFTCGMTRSWVDHVHGEVLGGLIQSPFGSLLFFTALAWSLWTLARVALRLPPLRLTMPHRQNLALWLGVLLLLAANWLYTILTGVA